VNPIRPGCDGFHIFLKVEELHVKAVLAREDLARLTSRFAETQRRYSQWLPGEVAASRSCGLILMVWRVRAGHVPAKQTNPVNARLLLIIILLVLLIGSLPAWPYSHNWGYWPGGTIGAILIILIIFALVGRA